MTVRCAGSRPGLESATPSNGYRFEVEREGPGELEVTFKSATREVKVVARCSGGVPRFAVEADDD